MVSPYILLRIHRSKMKCKRKPIVSKNAKPTFSHKTAPKEDVLPSKDTEISKVKLYQNLCRVCLKEGDIPIFGSKDLSQDLSTFAGIEITITDSYPKCLCTSCNTLLEAAIIFRKTAQETEQVLQKQQGLCLNNSRFETDDESYSNNKENSKCEREVDDEDEDFEIQIKKEKNKFKKTKPFHCAICNIHFKTIKAYKIHRLKAGHDPYRSSCPICKKALISYNLKKHIESQHVNTDPYMCDICGKQLRVYAQFIRHRETHFSEKFPYKCPSCPYRGKFKEYVKAHMKIHTGDKPHRCPQCPYRAARRYNLKKHMLTHKPDFEFNCDQCDKGFHTKTQLVVHIRVHHIGIRDQICNLCGKGFGHRKKLMQHQRKVHKKKRPGRGRYLMLEAKKRDDEEQRLAEQLVI